MTECSAPPVESVRGTGTYALVGNPNCGKTTLFNALTGLRQKTGNYAGVTVEKKEGLAYTLHGGKARLIDLPGTYSLLPHSPDEAVARDVVLGRMEGTAKPDGIICVVDASNLERHLYLVSQILELGMPVLVVLTMADVVEARGGRVDAGALARGLGVPVIPCQAVHGKGLVELKQALGRLPGQKPLPPRLWPLALERPLRATAREHHWPEGLFKLALSSPHPAREAAVLGLAGADFALSRLEAEWEKDSPSWRERLIAARYDWAHAAAGAAVVEDACASEDFTDRLDAVLVHPVWGWVVLFTVMALLFFSLFYVAEIPMGWIEGGFAWLSESLSQSLPSGEVRELLVDGIVAGIGGVVVFLPQILILFGFLGLLEDSGYMARAAFLMDRIMGVAGLHGKSFLPLLSSFACAVPGVMATRTIETPRGRLAAMLVAPFMSCPARLPVYALMIGALFPTGWAAAWTKALILMALYVLGVASAFGFALLFRQTLFRGCAPMLILELPPYHRPSVASVCRQVGERGKAFLARAGTLILGLSILLWFVMTHPRPAGGEEALALEQSYAGRAGKWVEPLIEPLGYNWKIGVGLLASQAAREVFVSTMAIVYRVEEGEEQAAPLRERMWEDRWPDGRRVFTPSVCAGLMVFFALSLQCLATVAVVRRETNSWRWPLFQFIYMAAYAYALSWLVYRTGQWMGWG